MLFIETRKLSCWTILYVLIVSLEIILSPQPAFAVSMDENFTIVIFPDTQGMVSYRTIIWESMPQWVADNKNSENILAVFSTGDITDDSSSSSWAEAVTGWNLIKNAGIIYVPIRGNHDAANFNNYFGPTYFAGKSWYSGSIDGSTNNNYWIKFEAGSHKYLVLALGYSPSRSDLAWASGIIAANPDREVIVVTHSYLNMDGSRTYEGNAIWKGLVNNNPGIFLVVCGHMHGGAVYAPVKGTQGNTVHQFLFDYQDVGDHGDGYMGILNFQPSIGKITTSVYSAYLGKNDSNGAFTLNYTTPLACMPKTCISLGNSTCGSWSDGCGGTINCGSCSISQICKGLYTAIKSIFWNIILVLYGNDYSIGK